MTQSANDSYAEAHFLSPGHSRPVEGGSYPPVVRLLAIPGFAYTGCGKRQSVT